MCLFLQVVVAVGQAQATLEEVHDDHFGILWVGTAASSKETSNAVAVELTHEFRQLGFVAEVVDHLEIRLQLAVTALVDGHCVHTRVVEVADFLCHAALGGIGVLRHFVNNLLNEDFIALVDFGEGPEGGILFRNPLRKIKFRK